MYQQPVAKLNSKNQSVSIQQLLEMGGNDLNPATKNGLKLR